MINHIKLWWRYRTVDKEKMYDIMDQARINLTFLGMKESAKRMVAEVEKCPEILDHKPIKEIYDGMVKLNET